MWGDPNKLSRDNLQKEDINPGVQYTGVPSQDELSRCPGVPTETRVKLGRVACIECVQEIPYDRYSSQKYHPRSGHR